MEDALLYQLRTAVDKYMHHAQLLEETMAGAGTRDALLISRVVRFRMYPAILPPPLVEMHRFCPSLMG
jgi:hypothetical protein